MGFCRRTGFVMNCYICAPVQTSLNLMLKTTSEPFSRTNRPKTISWTSCTERFTPIQTREESGGRSSCQIYISTRSTRRAHLLSVTNPFAAETILQARVKLEANLQAIGEITAAIFQSELYKACLTLLLLIKARLRLIL